MRIATAAPGPTAAQADYYRTADSPYGRPGIPHLSAEHVVALTWDFWGIDAAATEFRDSALLAPGCRVRTPALDIPSRTRQPERFHDFPLGMEPIPQVGVPGKPDGPFPFPKGQPAFRTRPRPPTRPGFWLERGGGVGAGRRGTRQRPSGPRADRRSIGIRRAAVFGLRLRGEAHPQLGHLEQDSLLMRQRVARHPPAFLRKYPICFRFTHYLQLRLAIRGLLSRLR